MKRWTMTCVAAALLALAMPGVAAAAFSGTASMDGDTCDTSQFDADEIVQGNAATLPTITAVSSATDPAHVMQGTCSIRYYMPAQGLRAENRYGGPVGSSRNLAPGTEVWVARWQYLDPSAWAQQGFNVGHHLTMQVKTTDTSTGGPFSFDDRGTGGPCTLTCWQNQFALDNPSPNPPRILSQPVTTGEWDAWLYRFVLSQDPAVGLVEIWKNGVLQFSEHHQTIDNAGNSDYYKQGIYQGTNITADSRAWIDGTTMSTSAADAESGAWGSVSKGPFVYDRMQAGSDQDLTAHSGETGATWSESPASAGGALHVSAGTGTVRADTPTDPVLDYANVTPPSADYTVRGDVKQVSATPGAMMGVAARADASSLTFYDCVYYQPLRAWLLQKVVGGTPTTLATRTQRLSNGGTYPVELSVSGSNISCTATGSSVGSVTDTSITDAGRPGIWARYGRLPSAADDSHSYSLDNFEAFAG
jgi:hypothetical protein